MHETEHEQPAEPMPRWFGAMRLLVIFSGICLVVGIAMFAAVFLGKAEDYSKVVHTELTAGQTQVAAGEEETLCKPYASSLSLQDRGSLVGIQLTARYAHATLQQEHGELVIVTLDRCSGTIVAQQKVSM